MQRSGDKKLRAAVQDPLERTKFLFSVSTRLGNCQRARVAFLFSSQPTDITRIFVFGMFCHPAWQPEYCISRDL